MTTSNHNARHLVEGLVPFIASNLHADFVNGIYVVYSYGWYPIFINQDGIWYENDEKYSRTTAVHISKCRPYNVVTRECNTEDLKDLIQIGRLSNQPHFY